MILAYITAYKQEEIRGCPNDYCVEKGMKKKGRRDDSTAANAGNAGPAK